MATTLVLYCTTWRGAFFAIAEDFPFFLHLGDRIRLSSGLHLVVGSASPEYHWVRYRGITIFAEADTPSRALSSIEAFRDAFLKDGWTLYTKEEIRERYPFFKQDN